MKVWALSRRVAGAQPELPQWSEYGGGGDPQVREPELVQPGCPRPKRIQEAECLWAEGYQLSSMRKHSGFVTMQSMISAPPDSTEGIYGNLGCSVAHEGAAWLTQGAAWLT
jgi:hypothetical protein